MLDERGVIMVLAITVLALMFVISFAIVGGSKWQ